MFVSHMIWNAYGSPDQYTIPIDLIETRGLSPLTDLLTSLGGWPVITPNWDEANFDFMKVLTDLRMLGNNYFVSSWVSTDFKDSTANILQVRSIISSTH